MIYKKNRNWTSTTTPMWQGDMLHFWRAGSSFEVREVSTDGDRQFIQSFATDYNLDLVERGKTFIFSPRNN